MKLKCKISTANELSITKKQMANCNDSTKRTPGKQIPLVDTIIHTSQTTQTKKLTEAHPGFTIISAGRVTGFLRGGHSQEYLLPPGMPSSPHGAVGIQGLLAVLGLVVTERAEHRTVCEEITCSSHIALGTERAEHRTVCEEVTWPARNSHTALGNTWALSWGCSVLCTCRAKLAALGR